MQEQLITFAQVRNANEGQDILNLCTVSYKHSMYSVQKTIESAAEYVKRKRKKKKHKIFLM